MRVLIAHDFMEAFGGAERVTAEIAAVFPDAPVYAILSRPDVAERMGVADRLTTLLPANRSLLQRYRTLAPLYPAIVKSARLPETDVIISSSYAYAHGFGARSSALKLCYCHGPLRHLWSHSVEYSKSVPGGVAGMAAFGAYRAYARAADRAAAQSVDAFITQSPFTAAQIREIYDRPAAVLAPPTDCDTFHPSGRPPKDYFLFAGRLVEAYKKPSLVVEAFARMPEKKLLIAGDGPALATLKAIAPPNVEFVGHLTDDALVTAMQDCRAAVFPSIDDYGLVPLEVNACGRPVLAVHAGGSLHTVKRGVTGDFIFDQTVESIVDAVRHFDSERYDPERIRAHALERSTAAFHSQLRSFVEEMASKKDAQPGTRTRTPVAPLAANSPVGV